MNKRYPTIAFLALSSAILIGCGGGGGGGDSQPKPESKPPHTVIPSVVKIPDETLDHQGEMQILDSKFTRKSGYQVQSSGMFQYNVPDETIDGVTYQRIGVTLPSGHNIQISRNLDITPRLPELIPGDSIQFYGEFVWDYDGGTIYWTYKDPSKKHPDGWLKINGVKVQAG
ncbi:DUF3465 domain-containing protein [Photobacterium damselae subsp. piscicida]|nr:DUF3465 domain-containing protein [Photobacterium damselae subsp. piscicida]